MKNGDVSGLPPPSPSSPELLFNFNFQSLEVVSRYRDTQLQVTENLGDLWHLSPNIISVF